MTLSRASTISICLALRRAAFTKAVWRGAAHAAWNGRFLFWDADFPDSEDPAYAGGEREFLPGSPTRKAVGQVLEILPAA